MLYLIARRASAFMAIGMIGIAVACSEPAAPQRVDIDTRRDQVRARETAFARSMAVRDLTAFTSFIAPEAVFVGAGGTTRGPQEIAAAWQRFFDGPDAPFSWKPETVEVLASGELALSSGPVFDPKGERVGTYNSTWRRDPDGVWRIIFDSGCP